MRVVYYGRVSSEKDEQINALGNQIESYKTYLEQHPEYELVDEYIDEGITGTSMSKRPSFCQMMEDAQQNKFDLIITREVSRFARNTVDTLSCTRFLKKYGIGVYFMLDNINTLDSDGELRLTIMATMAQDESRKISNRVKAGLSVCVDKAQVLGSGNILGYDKVNKSYVINEEQAKTVRMIFDWYLEGKGIKEIRFLLEKNHRLTANGKTRWYSSVVLKILKRTTYCGYITYGQSYVTNFLEQERIYDKSKQVVKKCDFEPIISLEDFQKVQSMIASKSKIIENGKSVGVKPSKSVWTDILLCGNCNSKFLRLKWGRNKNGYRYGYQCGNQKSMGAIQTRINKGLSIEGCCDAHMIPEWKLQVIAKYVFTQFLSDKEQVLNEAKQILKEVTPKVIEENTNSQQIEELTQQLDKVNNKIDGLIDMRAEGEITKEQFKKKKEQFDTQLIEIQQQLDELITIPQPTNIDDKITILQGVLDSYQEDMLSEDGIIPDNLIKAYIKQVVVNKDNFDVYLQNLSPDPNDTGKGSKVKTVPVCVQIKGNSRNYSLETKSPKIVNDCSGCNR